MHLKDLISNKKRKGRKREKKDISKIYYRKKISIFLLKFQDRLIYIYIKQSKDIKMQVIT